MVAKLHAFEKYRDLFAPREQALDLLAVDRVNLRPVLGAEIEWSANRETHIAEDDEVVRKLWGHQIPHDGYLAEILYDLGRPLAFNPPYMVLATYSPVKLWEPIVNEVRTMYQRTSGERGKGQLLLMVDGDRSPFPHFETFSPS